MTELREQLQSALGAAYTIDRELGGGGMSRVFVARDESLGREVVIKVVRPELLEGISVERFAREVQLVARLQQANIVPLLSAGDAQGMPYYIMPYVRGESLRARMSSRAPVSIAEALGILRDVARALAYAHGEGVVHRDIKPENILLSGRTAVVTDFGIAKALDAGRTQGSGGTLTGLGFSLGTPAYMAPEQAAGDPNIDFRADLYAWGVVAWELLAGRHPYADHQTPQALITAQMSEVPKSLEQLRSDVPARLADLVQHCLAKDPTHRPASADDVLVALDQVGTATPQPILVARLSRTRWIAAALTTVAAIVAAIVAWIAFRPGGIASTRERASGSINRIAVLPLENQTGDTTQRFFADGMTRELIGVLSDAGVRVLGHRAVASFRGSTQPLTEIAKTLGVDALVTGAVVKSGDEVQVLAELTDPRTGEALLSRTFTRSAADVVALQHDVVAEIARLISARLTPEQTRSLSSARQVNPKAYAQYLLGSEQANLRTPESFPRALAYLRRAILLDSTFAPSYASYAMANAYGLLYALTPTDSGRAAVEWGASKAIALDPKLGDAYIARGVARLHIDWDFARAEDDFARGLARQPSILARGLYMWTRWETGRCGAGRKISLELIELEPTTAQWRSDISWCYWAMRDSAAARASLMQAITVDSTFYEAFDLFGMVESDAGNIAQSAKYHDAAVRIGGDYWVRQFSEVVLHIAKHDTAGAKRVLSTLGKDGRLAQRGFMAYHIGLKDSAYTLLEKAAAAHDADLLWVLKGVPYFDPIRHEPRYQALLKRVGLAPDR